MAQFNQIKFTSLDNDPFFIDTDPLSPDEEEPKISKIKYTSLCLIGSGSYGFAALRNPPRKITRKSELEKTSSSIRREKFAPYTKPSTSKNPFRFSALPTSQNQIKPILSPTKKLGLDEFGITDEHVKKTSPKKLKLGPYGCNLLISNFPENVTEENLHKLFEEFGAILSVIVYYNKMMKTCSGCVSFEHPDSAKKAIDCLKNKEDNELNLDVSLLESQLSNMDLEALTNGFEISSIFDFQNNQTTQTPSENSLPSNNSLQENHGSQNDQQEEEPEKQKSVELELLEKELELLDN